MIATCLRTQERFALYSGVTAISSVKTETGELNECITGCAGCETWKSNRISTLRNHSARWTSTFQVTTTRLGKTTECHTTRAETAILDNEETAIDDCKFTHNGNFNAAYYLLVRTQIRSSSRMGHKFAVGTQIRSFGTQIGPIQPHGTWIV